MAPRPLRTVLVATDLTPASDAVVAQAATVARRAGAALHVLHVVEGPPASAGLRQDALDADRVRAAQDLLEEQLRRCASDDEVASREVRVDVPHDAIARRRAEIAADLVVVGPHGGGGFTARVLGTTAERVIGEAEAPCLVVRGEGTPPWRRVGVPTDLSVPAGRALDLAAAWVPLLADGEGAPAPELSLVHVGWLVEREDDPALAERLTGALERELERVEGAGVRTGTELLWANDPAKALVQWAERAGMELLVVPTHGQGGFKRALLGSTPSALARHAPCSVLLVPEEGGGGGSGDVGTEAEDAGRPVREPRLARIVIGADFSEPSNTAAGWATRHLAPDAEHVLIHAVDIPRPPVFLDHGSATHGEILEATREQAERRMRELTARLELPQPWVEVREGAPAEVLAAAAREFDADLLVVGEHTHPRGAWGVLGTTAERLVHDAPVPVLLARGVPDGPSRRILAAVDASRHADPVLAWAHLLSAHVDAELVVCHVLDPSFLGRARRVSGIAAARDLEQRYVSQGEAWLRERLEERPEDFGAAEVLLPIGHAPYEILAAQSRGGFDLVIMASRGQGAVARGLLGSVASTVLRGAACPVLVIGDDAREP
ncbi:MAG TPA: universal stress protein [Longimicrobiales bacterium]|nr:universal stress protein [Longimicrobiales bacterium]